MRIRPALPCCCSCRQAMATELKKQKPLGGGREVLTAHPSCASTCPASPLSPPLLAWSSPKGSSHLGLPQTLHGCGMVRMVSWGPNHSKTVLEMKRMRINPRASLRPHLHKHGPRPSSSQDQDGSEGPGTQPPGLASSAFRLDANRETPAWCVLAVSSCLLGQSYVPGTVLSSL